jgi:pseudouridine synthase
MRIQKYLSRAGVASRREAERLMVTGRIRVNGRVVTELGARVDPEADRVELDGRVVEVAEPRWIAFHKPLGVLTTRRDPHGGTTVYDLLPDDAEGLRYVGRLDKDTEGLLLLTNQGDALHGLTHPSRAVEREYRAMVAGVPTAATLHRLTEGVRLSDGPARAVRARLEEVHGDRGLVTVVLTEGRNREVRRMLDAVGHPCLGLTRVRFGSVTLGDLAPGSWRPLTPGERRRLRALARPS